MGISKMPAGPTLLFLSRSLWVQSWHPYRQHNSLKTLYSRGDLKKFSFIVCFVCQIVICDSPAKNEPVKEVGQRLVLQGSRSYLAASLRSSTLLLLFSPSLKMV